MPTPAMADACASHCYAYADWTVTPPSGFSGMEVSLRTNCMSVANNMTDFVTNEEWFVQGNYWVEAGITIGAKYGGGYLTRAEPYWADNRPGSGSYHEHYGFGAYTLQTYTSIIISKTVSSSQIDIYQDGSYLGSSTSNFTGAATTLLAGNETTTTTAHTFGSVTAMQWRDLTNVWHTDWHSASGATLPTPDAPLYSMWMTQYSWMRSGAGAAC